MIGDRRLVILSGSASIGLAKEICEYLTTPLGSSATEVFSDGELMPRVNENVRGADVFIVQSTHTPAADNLLELCLMIDACRRASAERINAVIPYLCYARQDRKDQGRVPLSAKVVANMITQAGADRVVTLDLHSAQIQGFFDIPVDHLFASKIMCNYVKDWFPVENAVVVSPDVGSVKRARAYAMKLNVPIAIIDKRRSKANQSEVMHVVGEVEGKDCFIFDDMIDTAGTIVNAAAALKAHGAKGIYAGCTHAVISGPARERLQASAIETILISNTIPKVNDEVLKKLQPVSVAPLLGETIRRIHLNQSVSAMFS